MTSHVPCGGRKNCVHKKDMFQEIFEKMMQADGIILGSPVYTANISANMQAFLERASVVTDMNRSENLLQHKVGAAVTAARRGGALTTLDAMFRFNSSLMQFFKYCIDKGCCVPVFPCTAVNR